MLFILMSHAGLLVVQPDLRMTSFGADAVHDDVTCRAAVQKPDVLLSGSIMRGDVTSNRQATPCTCGPVVGPAHDVICADVVMLMSHAGLLVVQPDVLLSGTRVAGSFKCARQAVLEERFGGDSGAKAVEGTLLHELFQVRPEGYHPLSGHAR